MKKNLILNEKQIAKEIHTNFKMYLKKKFGKNRWVSRSPNDWDVWVAKWHIIRVKKFIQNERRIK